jgi:hypothetical protein
VEQQPVRLDDLIDAVVAAGPDGDPLQQLTTAVTIGEHLGDLADHLIGHFVDRARRSGASWTDIGRSMGVSKQAVQKRFVPRAGEAVEDLMARGRLGRFTPRARSVVVQAQAEAQRRGDAEVGPLHVVLGLLGEPEGLGARALEATGVDLAALRAAVEARLGPAPARTAPAGTARSDHVAFSSASKRLLELSLREALLLAHNYIGTEHFLLAMFAEPDGEAALALAAGGVDPAKADAWLRQRLAALARQRGADDPGA